MQKSNKFSIRKLKTGVASVAIATILLGMSPGYVSASELIDESSAGEESVITDVEQPVVQDELETVEIEQEPEITTEEQTKLEAIPFETEYVDNSEWLKGKTVVLQTGIEGERTIIEEVTFSDGEEVSREVLSSEVTKAPQNEKIERGTLEYSVISETVKNYSAIVRQPWSINSKPWGVFGFELLANGKEYVGSQVTVLKEQTTERGTYALISYKGKEIGWIDKGALEIHTVKSTKNVQYTVKVTQPWSINSQPWGTDGYLTIGNGSDYIGQTLNVTQEKVTNRSTYLLLERNGINIGWIDHTGVVKQRDTLSINHVNYGAVVRKNWSINTQPWGTAGYKFVSNAAAYIGKTVDITQEKTTTRSTYALISFNGKELGWIDKTGIEELAVKASKKVDDVATVTQPWSINTQPWGTRGYVTVGSGKDYIGKNVQVLEEQVTQKATYALIAEDNILLGWIDKGALAQFNTILSEANKNYVAKVTKPWSINSEPWGTFGAKQVANGATYVGKNVDVLKEKVTNRSTYALISINGKQIGWIDKTGLEEITVKSTKDVKYMATIVQPWSINTQPWGVDGYELVTSATPYLGQSIEVVQEKVTSRGTYSLVRINGEDIGWLDKGALQVFYAVNSVRDVNYVAKVTKPWSINSAPWGTYEAEKVADGSKYVGKDVTVTQEKVTDRSTYALINIDGKDLGWIDKTGLEPLRVQYERDIRYLATVIQPWSINSQPWGTEGSTFIVSAKEHIGKDLEVSKEYRTQRGVYARVSDGGSVIGWIDVTGLSPYKVLTTKNVSYSATIVKPWSINTQPWGTLQYRPVPNYQVYLGKKAQIIQEKTTRRGTYSLLQIDGKIIGWIDKGALK